MENNDDKLKMIAAQALADKYGFCPAFECVKLLESFNEEYILFCVGTHEYRFDNGELVNIEDQKKLDEELSANVKLLQMQNKNMNELMEDHADQIKQFVIKEQMLTEAYNAKRMEVEDWKERMRLLQTLADDRKKEIERLEESNKQLKKERDEYIKLWLFVKEERDELQKRIYQCDKEPAE